MSPQAAFTLFLLAVLVVCVAGCIPDKPLVNRRRKGVIRAPHKSCDRNYAS